MLAASEDKEDIVIELLNHGADTLLATKLEGYTLFHHLVVSAGKKNLLMVGIMDNYFIPWSSEFPQNKLAKCFCICFFQKVLEHNNVKQSAALNSKDNLGDTPACLAAKMENYEVLKSLKEAGANLDTVNNENKNPLYYLVEKGVTLPVRHFCEFNKEGLIFKYDDPNGESQKLSILHIAVKEGNAEVATVLLENNVPVDIKYDFLISFSR